MSESHTDIEGWAIVDLFGHQHLAGYVSTVIIGTSGMLRCDVPAIDDRPAFTRFLGPGAIYSLTLTTQDVVLKALKSLRPPPITVYIPQERQLEPPQPETFDVRVCRPDDFLNEDPDEGDFEEGY